MVYLSIDVEASGPFPGLFSLVSIGAVAVRSDGRGHWRVDEQLGFYRELKPLQNAAELEAATRIHGLTREYLLEQGMEPGTVMQEFALFFKELESRFKKVIPAAWPSSFDSPYVGWYLQYFTGENPIGWSAFDIPSFGMGLFCCHRNALRNLMKKAGIEFGKNPNPHNALADAVEQGQTLANLLNYARQLRKEKSRTATLKVV
jgi:DNA polymerase III epsilon subunit-like protein